MQAQEASVRRYGALELRVSRRELLIDGRPVPIGARAWDLLMALVERSHRVVEKQELLDLVWPGQAVEEGNLQTQISALRRHIGRGAIATVPGRGYRFLLEAVQGAPGAPGAPGMHQGNVAGLLLGRTAERARLARAIDGGDIALLCGEAGMGKSRMLADLAQTHPLGAQAFVVSAARPGDAATPYASVARLLRSLAAHAAAFPPKALCDELARAVPEWGTPPPARHPEGRGRLAQACLALLAQAVKAGLRGLLFDDLHFADEASAQLLQPLLDERRCAWVLAAREHEISPSVRAVFEAQAAQSSTLRIALPPLDLEATEQLMAAFGHAAAQRGARAATLLKHTGGNPLFLVETLQLARARGPSPDRAADRALMRSIGVVPGGAQSPAAPTWPSSAQVKRVIGRRLAALEPGASRLLRCAAVAGDDFEPGLAAALLDTTPLALSDDWAQLEAAQILRGRAFAHDLVAEAAREQVPEAIAASLHEAVAAWLELHGAEPARVAAHWLRSARPHRAVPGLLAAAARARQASCPLQAHAMFDQAAELLAAAGERGAAFDAWFAAAEARSEVAIDQAYRLTCDRLDALTDANEGRAAMAGLARLAIAVESRRHDDALALAQVALERAQSAQLPELEVELLWAQVIVHWERRELADARQLAQRALARVPAVNPATTRLDVRSTHQKLVQVSGKLQTAAGDYASGLVQLQEARRMAVTLGDANTEIGAASAIAASRLEQGDAQAARAELVGVIDRYGARESLAPTLAQALGMLARLHVACGEPGAAWAASERALALCRQSHVRHEVRLRRQHLALAHALGHADVPAALGALRLLPGVDRVTAAWIQATRLCLLARTSEAGPGSHADLGDIESLLAEASRCPDLALRAELLCLMGHAVPPPELARALLMQLQTALVQAEGAAGLRLSLACAHAAVSQQLGREEEAVAEALQVWLRLGSGTSPAFEPWSDVARTLHRVMAPHDAAADIALRARRWAQEAAASLPREGRAAFMGRALEGLVLRLPPGVRPPGQPRRR